MLSLNIICQLVTPDKKVLKIEGIDDSGTVTALKAQIADKLSISTHVFDVMYRGCCLKDEGSMSNYKLANGCTVHLIKKNYDEVPTADAIDDIEVHQIARALKQIAKTPKSRKTFHRLMSNPDTVKNLIATTPSLQNDPVALSILRDEELTLLSATISKDSFVKVVRSHHCLGHAIRDLISSVNAVVSQGGLDLSSDTASGGIARMRYGLDQMSDEDISEDELMDMGQPLMAQGQSPAGQPSRQITADFFRQAIESVYAGGGLPGAIQPAISQSGGTPAGTPSTAQTSSVQSPVTEEALQQLRDMGIVDEALARRALEMTGGDIQLAIAYIFGDDAM